MVIIMDMNADKIVREPDAYDDEVLDAGWLPSPQPEVQLQLQQIEHERHEHPEPPPQDIDAFLAAMYRNQE